MATFTLTIEMDNDAFHEDAGELSRLLREVANRVEADDEGAVFDVNGNRVGEFRIA